MHKVCFLRRENHDTLTMLACLSAISSMKHCCSNALKAIFMKIKRGTEHCRKLFNQTTVHNEEIEPGIEIKILIQREKETAIK